MEALRFGLRYKNLVGGDCFSCKCVAGCLRHEGDILSPFVFVVPSSALCRHGGVEVEFRRYILGSVFDMYLRALGLTRAAILLTSDEFLPVKKNGECSRGEFSGGCVLRRVYFFLSVKQVARYFDFTLRKSKAEACVFCVEGGDLAVYLPSPAYITRRGRGSMSRLLLWMMEFKETEVFRAYGG